MSNQITLKKTVELSGIGLHSGKLVTMKLRPAPINHGVVFKRLDINSKTSRIRGLYHLVCDTRLGTTLKNKHGVTVATVEHLMAALWGAGIDNVLVEVDAPEIPIMDGSSAPFLEAIEKVGTREQDAKRRYIRILKPLIVRDGMSASSAEPAIEDGQCQMDVTIDFPNSVIARHRARYDFERTSFEESLSRARTFGFEHEVKHLQSLGLALGGSLENAIVVGKDRVLNKEGLRYSDEFVRHKALDCVGDLFLAGLRFEGRFTFVRPGHTINNKLLRKLFDDPESYEIITFNKSSRKPALQHLEALIC